MLALHVFCIWRRYAVSEIRSTNPRRSLSFPPGPSGEERNASKMTSLPESEYTLVESSQTRDSYDALHLYDGYNFVSVPCWLEDGYSTYGEFTDGVNASLIYRYDNVQGIWVIPSPNDEIVPLEGFVIRANGAQDITYHFKDEQYQIPPTRNLGEGWSLVGSWHFPEWSARDNFISIVDSWSQAMGFDAETQQYETSIINGGSGIHSDERLIYPGKGYWFWMTYPDTLVPLKGTKDFQDLNYPQVGVEWVNAYPDIPYVSCHLENSDDTALGFYNTLVENGWVPMFEYGDDKAQPSHFTVGEDWKYIDGVDVALFAGHGTWNLTGTWIRLLQGPMFFSGCEWGDNDLEWIFLHGCHTTVNPAAFKGIPYWAMNGIHLVCGYYTEGIDTADGENLADNLISGLTIKQSWENAIDMTHGTGITLRTIGENQACGNDYIWGSGSVISDPSVDAFTYDEWFYNCT
jgi:hypothetical protein